MAPQFRYSAFTYGVGISTDPTSVLLEFDHSSPFYVNGIRMLMFKILVLWYVKLRRGVDRIRRFERTLKFHLYDFIIFEDQDTALLRNFGVCYTRHAAYHPIKCESQRVLQC
jgi:hypothetical protein